MEIKSYQNQAELLLKEYILADSFIPYTSVICGICACKMFYDLTQLLSSFYFKSYPSLTKVQRTEWSNRSISTIHAIFITVMSLYFVFWSNLYSDHQYAGLVIFRSSALSTFALGVSVGYFLADLGMIIWFYPSLGGMEYLLHHLLSVAAVAYSMLTGEGQLYTFMVLISETTTPGINLRWYLDTAGMKRSRAYLINGVVIFVAWLLDIMKYIVFGRLLEFSCLCICSTMCTCTMIRTMPSFTLRILSSPTRFADVAFSRQLSYEPHMSAEWKSHVSKSGKAVAQLRAILNLYCAVSPVSYELNVVRKDHQGIKKDLSKAAVKGTHRN
ncbi:hypothetical protein CCACVL1_02363 [Corchorus capsularis]|uniref:TLC domain-containing protein n=1 Tax=Corchorus capsularis TaxID=210143 RepID=A0A1R3K8X6_COCAP|nr:hypothetical protein CCACVL1_02363 [Corchorus capsularis]